jgi:hypothetical protein
MTDHDFKRLLNDQARQEFFDKLLGRVITLAILAAFSFGFAYLGYLLGTWK